MNNIDIACDDLYDSLESYLYKIREFKSLFISLRDNEIDDKAYLRKITKKLDIVECSIINLMEDL